MKNSFRTYVKESPSNGEFFRANTEVAVNEVFDNLTEDYQRFRLNIDFDDIYTRQLVQTFHDTNTTEDFDYGYEIPHSFTLNSDAYWYTTEDEAYTAQAQPLDVDTTVLPLDMYISEPYTIRFRITDIQNFEEQQAIYLHDKLTNQYTDLRVQDVDITLDANYYSNRFEIVFKQSITLNTNDSFTDSFSVNHYIDDKTLSIINYNSAIEYISIYDMLGKKVMSFEDLGLQQEHTIDTSFLSTGPYVVKIHSKENEIYSKKIMAYR